MTLTSPSAMRASRILLPLLLTAAPPALPAAGDLWRSEGLDAPIVQGVFSADGSTLAVRTADGRIVVRDLGGARDAFAFSNPPYPVAALSLSANGAQAAWGDYRGNLYRWSTAAGLRQTAVGGAALGAVGQTADGAEIVVAGDGSAHAFLRASDLAVVHSQSTGIEQVHALALDATAATVFTGDHSGQVQRIARSGTQYSTSSRKVSNVGIRGLLLAPGSGGPLLCWDQDGRLRFLSPANMAEQASLNIGAVPVRSAAHNGAGILFLGLADGAILSVNLDTRTVSRGAELDAAVVGLHALNDGTLLALTEHGALHAVGGPAPGPLLEPPLRGRLAAAGLSLATGIGTLDTDMGAFRLRLADGAAQPEEAGAAGRPLAGAVLRRPQGPVVVRLTLEAGGLSLVADPAAACAPMAIGDWTPVALAAALWSPRLALMSGDGALQIRILEGGELRLERAVAADPSALWTAVRFLDLDRAVLQTGPRAARMVRLGDGAVVRFALPATARLDCAGFSLPANLLVFADAGRLYTLAPGLSEPVLRYTASAAQPILALELPPDRPEARIWTPSALVRLALPDGTVLGSQAHAAPLAGVMVAPDGPFALTLGSAGGLALTQIAGDPLVKAFPQLRPAAAGGMDTPAFGRLRASHGAWLEHEPFGWGYVYPEPPGPWFWFIITGGWLAGGDAWFPYLYSMRGEEWVFTLMPDHPYPWVYAFGSGEWRVFGP